MSSSQTYPPRSRRSRATALVAAGTVVLAGLASLGTAGTAAADPSDPSTPVAPVTDLGLDRSATAPATEVDQLLAQPDGFTFKARMTDLAEGGLFETLDGYGVERDEDGTWRYVTGWRRGKVQLGDEVTDAGAPEGLATGLGRRAVELTDGQEAVREAIGRQLDAMSQRLAEQEAADGNSGTSRTAARAGSGPKVFYVPALMLATWYDEAAGESGPQFHAPTDTPEYFEALLDGFGGNPYGSMTQFYYEASFGQFLVRVDVHGTYESVRSIGDPCYYGDGDGSIRITDPAGSALGLNGLGALGMATEAVPQAVDVPWSKYDNDGDGVVDFTMIIHSGGGHEVTGDDCNTHSHAITVSTLANIATGLVGIDAETLKVGIPTPEPGIFVNRIVTIPEYESLDSPLTIGVATHEMAHAIGEPDYYDTSYTSVGTGDYDIMSGGSYLGNPSGSNPAMQNPATRVFQKYVTPTIVHGNLRKYTLQARTALPRKGYRLGQADPNLLLVPTYEVALGQTDALGHTWTAEDVYGLAYDAKTKKYVVEGYYVENVARNASSRKLDAKNPMGSMFDRQMHSSGLAVWHFDYWRRSTTYFGQSNNAQNDSNRYQMDLEEFDRNDNTQELQLNLSRGNPADLLTAAATGITSGTRQLPPGAGVASGNPQKPIELTGTTTPVTAGTATFTVKDLPANEAMDVTVVSDLAGDCQLQLVDPSGAEGEQVDSGGPLDTETVSVEDPAPGTWTVRVPDFAACGSWTAEVTFSGGDQAGFSTKGAADTWSNWSQQPTGWAFTNVRGYGNGLDQSQEGAGSSSAMTLDVLNLSKAKDVSAGFASGKLNQRGGTAALVAGRKNKVTVPVFSNGGKAPGKVKVVVREGGTKGKVVARRTVKLGAYDRTDVTVPVSAPQEGTVRLAVTVDPANRVKEGSEANNTQLTDLKVGSRKAKVLVVDDDQVLGGENAVEGALASLGVRYATYGAHPSYSVLKKYDAVIWTSSVDRYEGQLDSGDRAAITAYLEKGGRVLLSGNRVMDSITTQGSAQTPASAVSFGARYFGVRMPEGNSSYIVSQAATATMRGVGALQGRNARVHPSAARQFLGLAGLSGAGAGALGNTIAPYGTAQGVYAPDPALLEAVTKESDPAYIGVLTTGAKDHGGFRTGVLGWNLGDGTSAKQTTQLLGKVLKHFGVRTGKPLSPKQRVIWHTPVRDSLSGTKVEVTAVVLGGQKAKAPVLKFRRHGKGGFYSVKMRKDGGRGRYVGTIPARAVTPEGVDYYIQAGSTVSSYGAPRGKKLTHSIAVAMPVVRNPIPVKE